jgi:outer membrane protein
MFHMSIRNAVVLAVLAGGWAGAASAQSTPAARVTVGAGLSSEPDYPGAGDNTLGPALDLDVEYLRLPGGIEFGSAEPGPLPEGLTFRGAFRYVGERDGSENSELRGLDDVDSSVELGAGLEYASEYWRAFGDVRYGFTGHNAFVGELGADAILRPSDDWVVNFGPRASWGASGFTDTYFGVSADEAEASRLEEFDASAGIYGVGVELGARYALSDAWGVEGRANYERLVGDAADSPITDLGSPNQFAAEVLITRSLSLGF